MARLRRFVRLGLRDQALLAGTTLRLGATQAALLVLPWRAARGLVRAFSRATPSVRCGEARIVWAVRAASRVLPFTTCFARALTMQSLLARSGFEATLVVGVARTADGKLVSHAWVERNQVPLVETREEIVGFTRLPADAFL